METLDHSELPDLSGRLLQLFLSRAGASEDSVSVFLLEYAKWQHIGGRLFIVGRVPETKGSEWVAGREAAVAWDGVSCYVSFRSRDEYEESAASYKPSLKERLLR